MKRKVSYDFKDVTPAQVEAVEAVLAEAAKHRYSVSRVYGAYNSVMGTTDKPESCPSCLRSRVKELQEWKRKYEETQTGGDTAKAPAAKDTKPEAEVIVLAQADPEGIAFNFTPGADLENPHKGTVAYADGTTVKPGKYDLHDGGTLSVQPGGKATITAAEDLT